MKSVDAATIVRFQQALLKKHGILNPDWKTQARYRNAAIKALKNGGGLAEAEQAVSEAISCPKCGHEFSSDELNNFIHLNETLRTLKLPSDEPFGHEPNSGEEPNTLSKKVSELEKNFVRKKRSAFLMGGASFERVDNGVKENE